MANIFTLDELLKKWANLSQSYRRVREKLRSTGEGKQSWPYYDLLDELVGEHAEALTNSCQFVSSKLFLKSRSPPPAVKSEISPSPSRPSSPSTSRSKGPFLNFNPEAEEVQMETRKTLKRKLFQMEGKESSEEKEIRLLENLLQMKKKKMEKGNEPKPYLEKLDSLNKNLESLNKSLASLAASTSQLENHFRELCNILKEHFPTTYFILIVRVIVTFVPKYE